MWVVHRASFHCLKNTKKLVGVDVSPDMLAEAKEPIGKESLGSQEIELLLGDIFTTRCLSPLLILFTPLECLAIMLLLTPRYAKTS